MARSLQQALVSGSLSGSSITRTFGSNLTSGTCLECWIIFYSATATISSVSDGTQSWSAFAGSGTALPYRGSSGLGTPTFHLYRFMNNALTSAPTVTVTFSASVVASIVIAEVAGAATSGVDDADIATDFSSVVADAGNLTTAEANEGIVAAATTNTNVVAAGTGYTLVTGLAAFYYDWFQYDQDVGAAGSISTAFGGSATSGSAAAFALKQAGGGGGGDPEAGLAKGKLLRGGFLLHGGALVR